MRPTQYDIQMLWASVKRLERNESTKVNICAFEDLMKRVNYLESINNDLITRVRRLEDEIQDMVNEASTVRSGYDALQEIVRRLEILLKHHRSNEQNGRIDDT